MKICAEDHYSRLHATHFQKLNEIRSEGCVWPVSRVPSDWAMKVGADGSIVEGLPTIQVGREALKEMCRDNSFTPEMCFASIMAWGGMKYGHGRKIWEHRRSWRDIIMRLRAGDLSRADAYRAFAQFRAENPGCGMGPAYYTKLIFFCGPDHDGYIMDQWTSLSVNLLFSSGEKPVVDMVSTVFRGVRTDTVTDRNKPEDYEAFCRGVEFLADRLEVEKPETVEEWLFSKGGRNPGPWRKYVKDNRPPVGR